jgi:hypothetical protein
MKHENRIVRKTPRKPAHFMAHELEKRTEQPAIRHNPQPVQSSFCPRTAKYVQQLYQTRSVSKDP